MEPQETEGTHTVCVNPDFSGVFFTNTFYETEENKLTRSSMLGGNNSKATEGFDMQIFLKPCMGSCAFLG